MIKERLKLIWLKITNYVTEPWKIQSAFDEVTNKKDFENGPIIRWGMYFLSYLLLIAFGFTFYSVMAALFFSFIIMKVDFRKDFYYLNYLARKDKSNESGTDTKTSE